MLHNPMVAANAEHMSEQTLRLTRYIFAVLIKRQRAKINEKATGR
jgi:hypothetical protein